MSVANLLQALGIQNVPPVPRPISDRGTENTHIKQSCTPCSPCSPQKNRRAEKKPERANPDAVLLGITRTLGADVHMLRALLSGDDMRDIAEGRYGITHLLRYFRLMRSDGKPLADPQWKVGHMEQMALAENSDKADRDARAKVKWQTAHDAYLNHIMACRACHASGDRYCHQGAKLWAEYNAACSGQSETTEG